MANTTEWQTATRHRAELIANLARYTAMENMSHIDIEAQKAVIQALFVRVEQIQDLVRIYEGHTSSWNEIDSYRRLTNELSQIEAQPRKMGELELLLEKRRELIRSIVFNLTNSITRVSIELERHKLITLALVSRDLGPLLFCHHQFMNSQRQNQEEENQNLELPILNAEMNSFPQT
jgi:hypothetical protein